jgi:cytosine/adenosine deaminase-related metal-dependent hydrolase
MSSFRITSATILTVDAHDSIVHGDLAVSDGKIVAIGDCRGFEHLPAIDFGGDWLMPGLVQAHVHLCQTLFRHEAEQRALLRWLRERIWPLEGAHDAASLRASARLGLAELLLGGTTTILDMGTVHHEDALIDEVARSGMRAAVGKAMMDAGQGVPASLLETTAASIDESVALARAWHGADNDRIRYAFAPRFILSCTPELQREVGRLSNEHGWLIHTHANEQRDEIEAIRQITGMGNIEALHAYGLCGPRSVFAHGVHLDAHERDTLRDTHTTVCHCPGSNLRLGSGIADVVGLLAHEVNVAIGADGAPCNNSLDALAEMRLAWQLASMTRSPGALTPAQIIRMATARGARALGWDTKIGTIAVGFDADLVRLHADVRTGPGGDHATRIVGSGFRDMVRDVWVRGERLVANGQLTRLDLAEVGAEASIQLGRVLGRAALGV